MSHNFFYTPDAFDAFVLAECVRFDLTDPYRGEYFCPHCWMIQDPVESGATLIITPSTISDQWIEEIKKHIQNTKIR
jgi:E3 ubiquitin-protein ligase SHPRH